LSFWIYKLNKKAFFIPTPGQFEQEYLAQKFDEEKIVPYSNQEDFKIEMLDKIELYSGFENYNFNVNWEELYSVF
jgi:hypothetical protein